MKSAFTLVSTGLAATGANAEEGSPIGKVLTMLADLESKIIKEGEVVQKEYAEFAEWCEDQNRDLGFEIKSGKSQVEDLKATIAEEAATIDNLKTKVEDLASTVADNDKELKEATTIRDKEAKDFKAEESELSESVDMLGRASGILEREMQGGASMLQLKNSENVLQAFQVMVQASLIETSDADRLTAFVQNQNTQKESDADADDDEEAGAPAAAVYKSKAGGVVDMINDLLEKAEGQLDELRKKEVKSRNDFELLKQSLKDEVAFAAKDLEEAKKGIAASKEKKATAEGDLETTTKDLKEDIKAKSTLHHDCKTKASAFEAETNSRGDELKALATAKKLIKEATDSDSLAQVSSFVQVRSEESSSTASWQVVRFVRDLARQQHSKALEFLATRMVSAANGNDPFGKVKGMITDMIAKLEEAAGADAAKKAYCDKELKETNAKKADKTDEIESLTTKIEQMAAKSAKLKEEVAVLENELSKLAKSQAKMDKLRQEEKAAFDEASGELEKGIAGVKAALKVLNEYYGKSDKAHDSGDGAASGIISLLEVVEADFSKNLAQITSEEEVAVQEYTKVTNENQIEKTTKGKDVEYKSKESKQLDKSSAELASDRSGSKEELASVLAYLKRIEDECIAKAETYEDRVKRREAEMAGLKQALDILNDEAASLLQQKSSARRVSRHV